MGRKVDDQMGIADRRLAALRARTQQRGDVATDGATPDAMLPATRDAASPVPSPAPTVPLQPRGDEEPKLRRAYTVFARQDALLEEFARQLNTDKGDVLRQIIDDWLRSNGLV